ncbi:hypothetical protein GIW50_09180 [Pseudomonas syringae]|uniref:Uncharacterized protein n=1 Tax=Pseudomonas syringae TaxID=317 RepID=A0A9Q3ZSY8_PSESX|nr:hypothetical protein [Pseudomonas syringae]MCF5062153.1 hypothetical protein [Pseudomonas syringae]MCF5076298.1 hypothetical protein [Pseudomonas syringae]MCF5118569.1 hypothetical protein [Pseudomonas syringae]MCF5378654.1 hypothetical protein [Pseudomonas syringae]
MHDKLSITLRPLCLNIALWAGGVALLLISKDVIEWATGSTRDSSLELALVLSAYLLLFLLKPIRAGIERQQRKRTRRHAARHRAKTGT